MATVVGTPVHAYIAAPLAAVGNSGTVWYTATINQIEAIEIRVDFECVTQATVSLPAQVNAYLSKDGGATFDTFNNPFLTRVLPRVVSSQERTTLVLPGGYWCLACNVPTPVTGTVLLNTAQVQTAVVFN